jgi:drug/metabolite transporter (DMT)-like permease
MTERLTPRTIFLLTLPPLLWAGNAIVGRLVHDLVPPVLLNFMRWSIALLILLALAGPVFRRDSALWPHWRRFALLGLLGIGMYNALQYMALQSSTPINVTLVGNGAGPWWQRWPMWRWGRRLSRSVAGARACARPDPAWGRSLSI